MYTGRQVTGLRPTGGGGGRWTHSGGNGRGVNRCGILQQQNSSVPVDKFTNNVCEFQSLCKPDHMGIHPRIFYKTHFYNRLRSLVQRLVHISSVVFLLGQFVSRLLFDI